MTIKNSIEMNFEFLNRNIITAVVDQRGTPEVDLVSTVWPPKVNSFKYTTDIQL